MKNISIPSNCNPVGYWKIEEGNICLTYDAAGAYLIPRRCKSKIEQKWAKNGTHICHPVKDKCFASARFRIKNFWAVQLMRYREKEDQKWIWNNDDTTQLESFNNLCLEDADKYYDDSSYIELKKCDENKKTQKWFFVPIIHANNTSECANFSERLKV